MSRNYPAGTNTRKPTYRKTLSLIEQFVYKEHWKGVDQSKLRTTSLDEFVDFDNLGQVLSDCMKGGALDSYSSHQHFLDDLKKYFNMATNKDCYFDAELLTYTAKRNVLDLIYNSAINSSTLNDKNAGDLFIDLMSARIRRQQGESYEIVPTEWFIGPLVEMIAVKMTFMASREMVSKKLPSFGIRDDRELLSVCMREFTAFFDQDNDKELLDNFNNLAKKYNNRPRELEKLYFQIKTLKGTIENFIDENPRIFLPFDHLKNRNMMETESFPLVIRLFRDGDHQFLFAKDVEIALKRATENAKRKNVEWNDKLLRIETDDQKNQGRYFCVSYSEYQKILKSLGLNDKDVTLVPEEITRTRHRTVPIISPYGTECIPAVDVFYELLGILTIEKQVWSRIPKERLSTLEGKLWKMVEKFMDLRAPLYFLATSQIVEIADFLRSETEEILRGCPKAKKPSSNVVFFTTNALRREVKKLTHLYPRIEETAEYVAVQCCQLITTEKESQLELQLAVQNCILICMTQTVPMIADFMHIQGRCMKIAMFSCKCRQRSISRRISENRKVSIYDETMFNVKLDYLLNHICYISLVDKRTSRKLVTNAMTMSYILQLLLNAVDSEYRQRVRKLVLFQIATNSPSLSDIYMTADEMMTISKEIVDTFKTKQRICLERLMPKYVHTVKKSCPECVDPETFSFICFQLSRYCSDCLQRAYLHVETPVALNNYFPKRELFVNIQKYAETENCCLRQRIVTNDVLSFIDILMKDGETSISDMHWDTYNDLVAQCQIERGWALTSLDNFMQAIYFLPIDHGRLHFVPNPTDMLAYVAQKAWDTLIDIRKTWWQEYLEIERNDEESKRKAKEEFEKRVAQDAISREIKRQKMEKKALEEEEKAQNQKSQEFISRQGEMVGELEKKLAKQKELHSALGVKYEKEREVSRNVTKMLQTEKEVNNRNMAKLRKEMNDQTSRLKQEMKKKNEQLEKMSKDLEDVKKREQENELKIRQQNEALDRKNEVAEELKTENANLVFQYGTLSSSMKSKMKENQELRNRMQAIKKCRVKSSSTSTEGQNSSGNIECQNSQNLEAMENENADLRRRIENLERKLARRFTPFRQSSFQNSACSSTSTSSEQMRNTTEFIDECGICLNELHENNENIQCEVCNTKWHKQCIEEWLTKRAQCPVCNRSLPSPQHFPPLE